jgi:hypothetical protein
MSATGREWVSSTHNMLQNGLNSGWEVGDGKPPVCPPITLCVIQVFKEM